MSNKAMLSDQQITINRFAFLLLKHFDDAKIKVQDTQIKIHVSQLCRQDLNFLSELYEKSGSLGFFVSKSGSGLCILIGVAQIFEIPIFLKEYKRQS